MLTSKEEQASFGFYELPPEILAQLESVAPAVVVEDEQEGPLSTAARQRRHRQKLKQQRETQGLKTLNLTAVQRSVLAIGLLHYEDFRSRPDLDKESFDRLLALLLPEDPQRYVEREWRPMDPWRERLERAEAVAERASEAHTKAHRAQAQAEGELQALRANQGRNESEYALTLKERGIAWEDNERLRGENERLQRENKRLQAELASMRAELLDIVGKQA